jgi:hypothetical protein
LPAPYATLDYVVKPQKPAAESTPRGMNPAAGTQSALKRVAEEARFLQPALAGFV